MLYKKCTSFRSAFFIYAVVCSTTGHLEPKCIKDIQAKVAGFDELSNQRITHMLTTLVKAKVFNKNCVKKVSYYSIKA